MDTCCAADTACCVDPVEDSKLRHFTNDAYELANYAEILLERMGDLISGLEGEPPSDTATTNPDSLAGLEGLGDAKRRISSALNNIGDGLIKLESLVKL